MYDGMDAAPSPPNSSSKSFDRLKERFKRTQKRRQQWENLWQDCYDYAMPARSGFQEEAVGENKMDKVFDETAIVSLGEFTGRMQSGVVPPFSRWSELAAGSDIADERQANKVNSQLEEINKYVFDVIQASNFSEEVQEAFQDLAVGDGTLLCEEGDFAMPIKFKAVPKPHLYFDSGPYGGIDGTFYSKKYQSKEIPVIWPEANLSTEIRDLIRSDPEKEIDIVQAVHRVWENRATETYKYCVFSPKHDQLLVEDQMEGSGSNPWITFRWATAAGEDYGRGPLMSALPAIKTCNLTIQLILENAELAIGGIYQYEDDGVLNPDNIELVPGTLIPRAPNSRGLEPVQWNGRFDLSQFVLEEMRHNIRKALFAETLGRPEGTPMSATEVSRRAADLAQQIGPAFGRLQTELAAKVIKRVVYLLKKQGRIEIPKVNGREIKVVATSPLAQAQNMQDVQNVDAWAEMLQVRLGPQMANAIINQEAYANWLGKQFRVPGDLIRTPEEQQQIVQQLMAAQQQMGGGGGPA